MAIPVVCVARQRYFYRVNILVKQKIAPKMVLFYRLFAIHQNRSVQLVARNRECPKGLNNIPCVVWSCIKMHATPKTVNYTLRLIIRATSSGGNTCLFRLWIN